MLYVFKLVQLNNSQFSVFYSVSLCFLQLTFLFKVNLSVDLVQSLVLIYSVLLDDVSNSFAASLHSLHFNQYAHYRFIIIFSSNTITIEY